MPSSCEKKRTPLFLLVEFKEELLSNKKEKGHHWATEFRVPNSDSHHPEGSFRPSVCAKATARFGCGAIIWLMSTWGWAIPPKNPQSSSSNSDTIQIKSTPLASGCRWTTQEVEDAFHPRPYPCSVAFCSAKSFFCF